MVDTVCQLWSLLGQTQDGCFISKQSIHRQVEVTRKRREEVEISMLQIPAMYRMDTREAIWKSKNWAESCSKYNCGFIIKAY